jgi:hypothetical protein
VHGSFVHGVASGDPTSDAIILWTRVTPTGRDPGDRDPQPDVTFPVTWVVWADPAPAPAPASAPGVFTTGWFWRGGGGGGASAVAAPSHGSEPPPDAGISGAPGTLGGWKEPREPGTPLRP